MPATNSNALFPIPEGQETAPAVGGSRTPAEARAAGRLEAQESRVGELTMPLLLSEWFVAPADETFRVLFRPYNGVSGWVEFTPSAIRLVKENHWAGPERPLIEHLGGASDNPHEADQGNDTPSFRFHVWGTSAAAAVMRAMIFGRLRDTLGVTTNEAVLTHPAVQIVSVAQAVPKRAKRHQHEVSP